MSASHSRARGRSPSRSGDSPEPSNAARRTADVALERAGHVRLDIYDLQGRKVRTLLDGPRFAGPLTATWKGEADRGERVAAGVYVARLTASGAAAACKLVVLH